MMKKAFISFYTALFILFELYLAVPTFSFPRSPLDSQQSLESGDTEVVSRRAYFTNLSRNEVLDYYQNQFERKIFGLVKLPTLRLNYPPEEAQLIIRDQTRSTYLQEIVHPFRESIYINGFEPHESKDAINIEGRAWRQKITIKYVDRSVYVRCAVGALTYILSLLLLNEVISTAIYAGKVAKK